MNRIAILLCLSTATHFAIAQVGNVGINTTNPQAILHVADSSVLFSGPTSLPVTQAAPPVSGTGLRTMWYVDKAAFRTGRVTGSQWDKDNIGNYSFASGLNNIASGTHSVAMGTANISSAQNTFTAGSTNRAAGTQSFAMGLQNRANASYSAVFGRYNDTLVAPNTFSSTSPLFMIGNGASSASRSNALTVLYNGFVGMSVTGSPQYRLHVANNDAQDGGYVYGVFVENTSNSVGEAAISFRNKAMPSNKQWNIGLNQTPALAFNYNSLFVGETTRLVIDTTGTVGVGTIAPNPSALMDLASTNKGVLVPRIALTSANVAAPVSAPANALLIYNTATAGNGVNEVFPGFYYWDGTFSRWKPMRSSSENNGSVGYGSWGDCEMNNVSQYQPTMPSDGSNDTGLNGDLFGSDVAIDGNTAIVSSRGDDVGGNTAQGSAYIFTFDGSTWIEQQKLVASDGAMTDRFGHSVAISGNYAVISADADINVLGSIYVFHYNGTSWVQQQKLTASDGAVGDQFGIDVSISGTTIAVGAFRDDVGANMNQGSVYTFNYNGTTWVQQQKMTASDGATDDEFGVAVSIDGNYLLVGAGNDQISGNTGQGSAYVFFFNGSTWSQQQKLIASDGDMFWRFGSSLYLRGSECLIAANGADAAYHFTRSGTVWTEVQIIQNATADQFGTDICFNEDYLLISDVVKDVDSVNDQGIVFLYRRLQNAWIGPMEVFHDPMGGEYFRFGNAVSLSGDRFVIGSSQAMSNRGRVVFGKID